jgi:hypothetical protein
LTCPSISTTADKCRATLVEAAFVHVTGHCRPERILAVVDDARADHPVERQAVNVDDILRPEGLPLPVRRLIVELLDPLIPIPVDGDMRRVHQHQLVDEAEEVSVLTDERVAVQQQMHRRRRPEPVGRRVIVRLVMQQRPRAMRSRFDPVAVLIKPVNVQWKLADLLGDHRHGRPDGGDPERVFDRDFLSRSGRGRDERAGKP